MTNLKTIGLVIAGVIVGLLFSVIAGKGPDNSVRGVYNTVQADQYFKLVSAGTCTLIGDVSIAATSTGSVDCAVSGYTPVSGDIVKLTLAASTTMASQYVVKSPQASTTNGYLTTQLINLTGTARVPSATNGFGSTTQYEIWRRTVN